jgi:hypothetical protein
MPHHVAPLWRVARAVGCRRGRSPVGRVLARGDRSQLPEMAKGERQGMNSRARYCFETSSPDEGREHLTSSQGARFLLWSERAWNLIVHRSPSVLVPRISPSKLAGPSWPTGRPTQRRSGPRFPGQPSPAWSSHPLLTAGARITDAATRSRIRGNGGVGSIEREGIPGHESVNEAEAFDKTSVTGALCPVRANSRSTGGRE